MSYSIRLTKRARADIHRLYGFLLARDKKAAERAYVAIDKGISSLAAFSFSCRKADPTNSFLREMIISFDD